MKNASCLKSLVLDDECLDSMVNGTNNELNLLPFRLSKYYLNHCLRMHLNYTSFLKTIQTTKLQF